MDKHEFPSIEQFAAFLDGNLSQNEMQQFSNLVDQNDMLHQLTNASHIVDDTIEGFTESDLQLPEEITDSDFELPEIKSIDEFALVNGSLPDNDHFRMDLLNGHPNDGSLSSHLLEPFHELYSNGELADKVGDFPIEDASNNGLKLLDETIGNVGMESHVTPLDELDDNTDFHLGD